MQDGPLGVAVADLGRMPDDPSARLLYLDADLADRDGLRRALGLPPGPHADADLILRAYARWGEGCADRLCGAFAFLLWDGARRVCFGARDPVGIAPLRYAALPGRLAVGGDVRRLLEVDGVGDALDADVFVATLLTPRFNGEPHGRTCLRDVRALPPGHTLRFDAEGVRTARYWHPEDVPSVRFSSMDAYVEAFRALLDEVVAEYVPPEEPLGVHVTGGLDSSLCVALASRLRKEWGAPPPVGFSWLTPPGDPPSDEHERTALVAAEAGMPLVHAPMTVANTVAFLRRDATRDPYASTLLHEHVVQQAASDRGVRVILSGWGGDEAVTFSGRMTAEHHLARRGRWTPVWRSAPGRGRAGWKLLLASLAPRRSRARPIEAIRRDALRGAYETYVDLDRLRQARLPALVPEDGRSPAAFMCSLLTDGHLAFRTVAWAVSGAALGLRYRYPLLDRRLLDFVFGLPPEVFLPYEGERRWLMRRALAGRVSERIRRHTSKKEPARLEPTEAVLCEALSRLGDELRVGSHSPAHFSWFDANRVEAALTPGALAERRRYARLAHAVVHLGLDAVPVGAFRQGGLP